MKGFTHKLQSAEDLLEKLKWNLQKLEKSPSDVYAAFDFFVTAEHIPDWINKKSIKEGNDLLKLVSHIANGAKHFEVSDKRHKSVERIEIRTNLWPDDSGVQREHIYINFKMCDGRFSGLESSALSIARLVYDFWESTLKKQLDRTNPSNRMI